ncbi:MAG TPA: hypothetical protein VMF89_07370 [Polyangiales bacterium]|nr:hypothetical protein [Polyangiales bacterium]
MHLAAVGCGSALDASAEAAPAAGAAAAALALEQEQAPAVYSALPPSDPIVGIAHGAIFTSDRGVVSATPEFVREVQLGYLERLRGEASSETLEQFEPIRVQSEPEVGAPREFADRAYLINWLIEQVRPSDSSALSARNTYLAQAVEPSSDLAFVQQDLDQIRAERLDYQAECLRKGVPTPPDWLPSSPENKWVSNGGLNPDFIGKGSIGEVWYYIPDPPEPRGLCIALPRANATTGEIELLGVICQGNDTSKACFWDNDGNFQPGQDATITDNFEAAKELVNGPDRCTDCHRGENVFIVHPNSPLDIDIRVFGAGWEFDRDTSLLQAKGLVEPIVYGDWENRLAGSFPDVAATETSCVSCHKDGGVGGRLGALDNPLYCSILWYALRPGSETMPFASPITEGLSYPQTHYAFVADACRGLTPGMRWD